MFKKWLKELLATFLCAIIFMFSLPTEVFANSYVKDSEADAFTYYIVDGKSVDKLFDFGIDEILGGKVIDWLFNFRSFTVIKEYINKDGMTEYKVYFNTPNLQSIVKNQVVSAINDGYTDHTYDVNETEWMVDVGPDAPNQNAITKYGFDIPNYTYMGEFPKEIMTVAGILPTGFWDGLWRSILSIFGVSFLRAPDASNFNTISYLNHQYSDSSSYLLELFQKYYIPYFVEHINNSNFATPEDLINSAVTLEERDAAKAYTDAHKEEYENLVAKYEVWNNITDENGNVDGDYDWILNSYMFENNFDINMTIGDQSIEEWLASEDHVERFANLIRTWKTNNAYMNADNVLYFLACAYYNTTYLPTATDEDLVKIWYGASAVATDYWAASRIRVKPSYYYSNNSTNLYTLLQYYGDYSYTTRDYDYEGYIYHTLTYIYGTNPTLYRYGVSVEITLQQYKYFLSNMSLFGGFRGFELEDFLTEDEQLLYEIYNQKLAIQENYDYFKENFGKDEEIVEKGGNSTIGYSQCLIASEDEEKCESKVEDGETPTSISVATLYAFSGLYHLTEQAIAEGRTELTTEEAILVIGKIKDYCGPFYEEVLANMVIIMTTIAINSGETELFDAMTADDPRVMPYDVAQMTEDDQSNYAVIDPRVELYKTHIIGGLVSNITLNFGFGIYIKPQQLLVNLGGKITEFSVFLQQMCDFDKFDDLGLSPTNMWQSAFTTLLMLIIATFFIVKTVIAIIKMGTRSMVHLIIGFLCLVLELGFITAFALNPEGMWENIKNIENSLIYLGEKASTAYTNPNTNYLFGDAGDGEVLYYMPYLDLWSKYNTGYGLTEDEQLMDPSRDKADLKDYDFDSVRIGSQNVKHYSILLADAFSYYGDSVSVTTSVIEDGVAYNGPVINNNAYRVVDHFLAPRVNVSKSGSSLTLSVTENENYNGQFQGGFIDLICKLLNCILMCLLSVIKFFTFIWQWFLLYILIFKSILGRSAEGKNWAKILLETFAPTLAMIMIGLYSSIILFLGMLASGFVGILMEVGLFAVTFLLIRWWRHLSHGLFFPKSLAWLYLLTNMKHHQRHRHSENLRQESKNNAKDVGLEFTEEEQAHLDKRTERLFNEDGTFKQEYNNNKYKKVYEDWYKFARNSKNIGRELTPAELAAMRQFESDDRYKDFADAVNKYGTGKRLDKQLVKKKIGSHGGGSGPNDSGGSGPNGDNSGPNNTESVWDRQVNEENGKSDEVNSLEKAVNDKSDKSSDKSSNTKESTGEATDQVDRWSRISKNDDI